MIRPARGILILTIEDDLHALVVQKQFQDSHGLPCHIVESDRVPGQTGLSWSSTGEIAPTLPTRGGGLVDVRTVDVVWWRRFSHPMQLVDDVGEVARDIITNDCRSSIEGLLLNEFAGTWISSPQATRLAENKLVQLDHAQRAGFRVPRTLVSQNPAQIRGFCRELGNRAIIKSVKGTTKAGLLTLAVDDRILACDEMLSLAPAMYQELIGGTRHIRANCFGDRVHAVQIETDALDWRPDLTVPMASVELPAEVNSRLLDVLRALGLRMGIVDLKLTLAGEPVWLEVNPQGQFLFIEGLIGLELTSAFCDFLFAEAAAASAASTAIGRALDPQPPLRGSGAADDQPH